MEQGRGRITQRKTGQSRVSQSPQDNTHLRLCANYTEGTDLAILDMLREKNPKNSYYIMHCKSAFSCHMHSNFLAAEKQNWHHKKLALVVGHSYQVHTNDIVIIKNNIPDIRFGKCCHPNNNSTEHILYLIGSIACHLSLIQTFHIMLANG